MDHDRRARFSLASVLFTFFIDNLSWSIVFPIFSPLFLDSSSKLFDADVSVQTRTAILGFFLMAFSLGQFLGAPLLGEYADRRGRRKALALSVFFTLVGFALTSWSVQVGSLSILFMGRLITGIFASNMSICLAAVSDLSEDPKEKVRYFGYLSVIAGVSFILGGFVGGKLSDPTISPLFSPQFPLWIATGFTLVNYFFILFGFRETSRIDLLVRFNFLESFQNIQKALKTEGIQKVYLIYFLFLFAWTILFQFVPVLAVRYFDFSYSNNADLALFMGICWAIGSGYLNKILMRRFSGLTILKGSLLLFTLCCALVVFPTHIYWVLAVTAGSVIMGGLAWPHCTGFISDSAPKEIQGKIMGISQSVQSLAMTLSPALGGIAAQFHVEWTFLLGAAASMGASVLYLSLKKRNSES